MANKGETRSRQGKEETNISKLELDLYESLSNKDEHVNTYDDINAIRSTHISGTKLSDGKGRQTANARDTTPRLEVNFTRRTIVFAFIGSMLLSALISVIVGVTVYHMTIAKMAVSDKQSQDITSGTVSSNQVDTLALEVKQLKNNLTTTSEVWSEEIGILKKNISDLHQNSKAKDCSELYAAGTVEDGVYTISPDGRCPFHVYCDMTGGGWTQIQKRIDGHVSFYRTWDEYVEGFGNIDGEHWLGLDKIHRLTADGSQIYFQLKYYDGRIGFAHYQSFTVHDANTAYRMNVDASEYNGTIKELFSYHDNMKFSTYDRDNDARSYGNCAKTLDGGGWWYNDCWRLGNLNGVYGKREGGGIAYWDGGTIPLESANMKVKGYC